MSLMDGLLLDPAPFNVWIARRSDGLKGSGTASDPFDGGLVLTATKSITSITRAGTLATATLAAGQGFQNGNFILMAGAISPASAPALMSSAGRATAPRSRRNTRDAAFDSAPPTWIASMAGRSFSSGWKMLTPARHPRFSFTPAVLA